MAAGETVWQFRGSQVGLHTSPLGRSEVVLQGCLAAQLRVPGAPPCGGGGGASPLAPPASHAHGAHLGAASCRWLFRGNRLRWLRRAAIPGSPRTSIRATGTGAQGCSPGVPRSPASVAPAGVTPLSLHSCPWAGPSLVSAPVPPPAGHTPCCPGFLPRIRACFWLERAPRRPTACDLAAFSRHLKVTVSEPFLEQLFKIKKTIVIREKRKGTQEDCTGPQRSPLPRGVPPRSESGGAFWGPDRVWATSEVKEGAGQRRVGTRDADLGKTPVAGGHAAAGFCSATGAGRAPRGWALGLQTRGTGSAPASCRGRPSCGEAEPVGMHPTRARGAWHPRAPPSSV